MSTKGKLVSHNQKCSPFLLQRAGEQTVLFHEDAEGLTQTEQGAVVFVCAEAVHIRLVVACDRRTPPWLRRVRGFVLMQESGVL